MTDLNNADQFDTGYAKGHSDDIMSSFLTEEEIRSWKQDLQKLDSDVWKKETDFAAAAADGFGDISDFFKNEEHADDYAGFHEAQGLKESHSVLDDGENTGKAAMDSFWGREAGLTADRDLISEFIQESVAKDQAITRVQDARISEDDVYATDDKITEDDVIALDDRVSEDNVYATDDRVTEDDVIASDERVSEYDVYATDDKVTEDNIAATDDRVSEDEVYATDESVTEDEVIASDDRVSEDNIYATDDRVAEDVVYATDQEIQEEEIAPDQDISYTYTTPDPRKGSTGHSPDPASNKTERDLKFFIKVFVFIIIVLYILFG